MVVVVVEEESFKKCISSQLSVVFIIIISYF